jgi:glucuronokinase
LGKREPVGYDRGRQGIEHARRLLSGIVCLLAFTVKDLDVTPSDVQALFLERLGVSLGEEMTDYLVRRFQEGGAAAAPLAAEAAASRSCPTLSGGSPSWPAFWATGPPSPPRCRSPRFTDGRSPDDAPPMRTVRSADALAILQNTPAPYAGSGGKHDSGSPVARRSHLPMIITSHAYARAGLIGNPSDGYYGKTISFVIRNFKATVCLWESPHFEIVPTHGDLARFGSVAEFVHDVKLHGYYGAMRLIKAAIKKFHEYCNKEGIDLPDRSFTVSVDSDIPRLVGMSGSSAIITAMFRAMTRFYGVEVPKHYLPTLVLAAEREELAINAGLQDRVIQVYEGIVYMDFEREHLDRNGYGLYEELLPPRMPPLYVAYDVERAEVSDIPHKNLRQLFERGDPTVVGAMRTYRDLTDRSRVALMAGDWDTLGRLMNENFDLRRTFMPIAPRTSG